MSKVYVINSCTHSCNMFVVLKSHRPQTSHWSVPQICRYQFIQWIDLYLNATAQTVSFFTNRVCCSTLSTHFQNPYRRMLYKVKRYIYMYILPPSRSYCFCQSLLAHCWNFSFAKIAQNVFGLQIFRKYLSLDKEQVIIFWWGSFKQLNTETYI